MTPRDRVADLCAAYREACDGTDIDPDASPPRYQAAAIFRLQVNPDDVCAVIDHEGDLIDEIARLRLEVGGPTVIAALYVETDGPYYGLEGVDPWDITRDARLYPGPWPVVAHPPCNVWCQLASVNQARWGKMIGDGGGTFAAALAAVRRWGGVLEHPACSLAWTHYGLPVPTRGAWTQTLWDGWATTGMSTEVWQGAYGHPARKRTWLYTVGVDPARLNWSTLRGNTVIGGGIHSGECIGRTKLDKATASRTPTAFRDLLIGMARSVAEKVR